jgi:hypothetical protein
MERLGVAWELGKNFPRLPRFDACSVSRDHPRFESFRKDWPRETLNEFPGVSVTAINIAGCAPRTTHKGW